MRCSGCGIENSAGRKFCSECGTRLVHPCPQCGADNEPAARFCGECGTPLNGPLRTSIPEPLRAQRREIAGERRHLTVLFCDLVGSTEISSRLDPEDWRDIAAQYQKTSAAAVTRFGGHVAKYLGDIFWHGSRTSRRKRMRARRAENQNECPDRIHLCRDWRSLARFCG
jgi:hypothetical protein